MSLHMSNYFRLIRGQSQELMLTDLHQLAVPFGQSLSEARKVQEENFEVPYAKRRSKDR